jgi:hypothetical protein
VTARAFDRDPFAPTFEEKIFVGAKRICFFFAGSALALSALDLAGVHSVTGARNFWQASRDTTLALSETIRSGALLHSDDIVVSIPVTAPNRIASRTVNPQIVALSDARREDAMRIAMAPPPMLSKSKDRPFIAASLPVRPVEKAVAPVAASNPVPPQIAKSPIEKSIASSAANVAAPTPAVALAEKPLADLIKSGAEAQASATPGDLLQLASADPNAPIGSAATSSLVQSGAIQPAAVQMTMDAPIPLSKVRLPVAAPGVPPPSPAERLHLKDKDYAKAERCLANAIYIEARSEPVRGQMAVAQVVMNRVFSGFYPHDVCGVVYQNAHRRLACQFTFACDGKRKVINEYGAWARANRIARQTLDGRIYLPEVGKSTHYHASYVHPYWARAMHRLVRYGLHSFYRPYAWGNGAEEPVWGTAEIVKEMKRKHAKN